MDLRRRLQLLRDSNTRMRTAIDELEMAVAEMENIQDVAAAGSLPMPKVRRWWAYMRYESWIQLKKAAGLWWYIVTESIRR